MKIALYETITPGNIGAVARAMKNFGFSELLLVKPKCDHLCDDAVKRSCHGEDVLKRARVITEDELFKGFVVGTTSKAFTLKAHRQAVTPDKLVPPRDAVILFGREDNGLPNQVLSKCNAVTAIMTGTKYKSLNLSHSVAIILYELRAKDVRKGLISNDLRQELIKTFIELGESCEREESIKGFIKNIFNRSFIYEKEGRALIGLLKELIKRVK